MRGILVAAALGVAIMAGGGVALSTRVEAQAGRASPAASLTGDWEGRYVASGGGETNTFTLKMRQSGGAISGTIYEPNTIGDQTRALFLTSTFSGTIVNDQVRFSKTYDGSGGVSHSIYYAGVLEPGGRRIRGTYSGFMGTFEIVR